MFVDDLKVYQKSHEILKGVNEIFVKTSYSPGALYGTENCTETIFERAKMVEREGLYMLQERMKILNSNQKNVLKFLGIEGTDGVRTIEVKRVNEKVIRKTKKITKTKLRDKSSIKAAMNTKVKTVSVYPMKICTLTIKLDKVI